MIVEILIWICIVLVTVTLHEVSHGVVAYLLGDPTAKYQGRLTLNPLKHIDLFWTVLLPATLLITTGGKFAIGMAKPVPVDFRRLKPPRLGMVLVGLAGPLANIILASFLNFFLKLSGNEILLYAIYFNLGLAMFNLIPIPPLDGSRVLTGLLPVKWAYQYTRIEPYGFIIILVLYFTRVLFHLILPGIDFLGRLLDVPALNLK